MNEKNIPFRTVDGTLNLNVVIEGEQVPDILVEKSGVWIQSAGSAILSPRDYQVIPADHWLWIATENGQAHFTWNKSDFPPWDRPSDMDAQDNPGNRRLQKLV